MCEEQKMEYKLNSSPHLKMCDITKRLFNRNFHSDVQFSVGNKIIYAHSLELMKRSVVFEQQFEDANITGNQKISIVDFKYESFLEFIRFIYTDECKITKTNGIELLKLATQYQVIMLENRVINFYDDTDEWGLQLFEHCVVYSYDLIRNVMHDVVANNFSTYLKDEAFLSLHPDAIDALLKFDRIENGVTEKQIFTALGNWILSYCKTNQMSLLEGREKFDYLIRKIRFPAMSIKEIRETSNQCPGLHSTSDRSSIAVQAVYGGGEICGNDVWISKCRDKFDNPFEWVPLDDNIFETRIFVLKETILHGLRIGNCSPTNNAIEANISTKGSDNNLILILGELNLDDVTINLGDGIRMNSNCEYTITIKYLNVLDGDIVGCRKEGFDTIINDETKSVDVLNISNNVFELFFKSPAN